LKKTKKRELNNSSLIKNIQKHMGRYWMLYCMLIPGILYLLIFKYIPMYGVIGAFKDYDGVGRIMDAPWVGWKNFERIFSSRAFKRALENNIVISIEKLIFGFPTPIILALLIDSVRNKKLKRLTQTAVILPGYVSWVVVYGLVYAVLSPSTGVVSNIAEFMGYQGKIPDLLVQKDTFRGVIIFSYVWKEAGLATIMYLAAIAGIDQELYEAAILDGAGRFRQMWHITLSGIRPTIATLFIIRVGNIMYAGFDQIYAMSNEAVMSVADILDTYVHRIGLQQSNFSLSIAAGLFQSAIGLVLVLGANYIAKKIEPDSGLF